MGNCMSSKGAVLSPTARTFRDKPTLSMSSDYGLQHSSIHFESARDVNELIRDLPDTADVKALSSIAMLSSRGRKRGSSAVSLLSNEDNPNFHHVADKLDTSSKKDALPSYDQAGPLSSLSEHVVSESSNRSRTQSYMSFVDPLSSIAAAENNLELFRQIQAAFPSSSSTASKLDDRPSKSPRSSSETDADSSSFSSSKAPENDTLGQLPPSDEGQSPPMDPKFSFFVFEGDDIPRMSSEKDDDTRRSSCYIVETSRDSNGSQRSSRSYSPRTSDRSSLGFPVARSSPLEDVPSFVSPRSAYPPMAAASKIAPPLDARMSYESHYSLMSFSQSFAMDVGSFDDHFSADDFRDTSCSTGSFRASGSSEPGLYL
ncbi:hypothetical protein SPRG_05975 [Saprolegnia parasitica CBS 223.65]|uniref:Uncharacterized protein n=1 Tax=Saprolegnia parasitica (strain CBS 223.65) TaxID=695850 RepID=A0A067CG01_SAPPC|nr:hypothetical protein SPRG_05975 [Saprolegnia parasitica CBS 223.65]KDO29438.1 hypothetical protein SPRG_05975 [Saprolegnia parasitica CBS 223.65]|eukprot:XP_012199938.1 hypothetical protein SPRG_05975 [Saprolegnia parasitica CBS 223.65]